MISKTKWLQNRKIAKSQDHKITRSQDHKITRSQDHFSLSEALTTAMTAATAQYYGGEVSSAFKTLNSEATAAHAGTLVLASAKQAVALQVGNMIAGTSSHFDIKEVVTNMAQSLASIKAGSYSENPYASAAYATTAASAVDSVATHNLNIEALGAQMLGNEALAGVSVAAQKYLQPSAQRKQDDFSDESTQNSTVHGSTYDEHQREADEAFYNKMENGLPGQLPDPSLDISPHAQALADNTNARAGSWKTQTQQKSGIATAGTWKAMPKQSFTNAVANDLSNDAYNAYDAAKAFNSDKSGSTLRLLKAMETMAINAVSQEVQNTPKLIFDVARSITNPSSIFVNNYAEQGAQLGNSVPSLYNAYSNADPATRNAMLARGVATGIEGVGAAALTRGAGFGVSAIRGMSFIGSATRVGTGIMGEMGAISANTEKYGLFAETKNSYKIYTLDHSSIKFSQTSVNDISEITESMKLMGWVGDPIDVVKMSDGSLITMDNTRLLAASRTNTPVRAIVHDANERLSEDFSRRFTTIKGGAPNTWEEAVRNRLNKQSSLYREIYTSGSYVIGAK